MFLDSIPASYASSREKFRQLADKAHWQQAVTVPLSTGQGGNLSAASLGHEEQASEALTVDVAYLGPKEPRRTVLVTSGLHGVEGFFGAAVQLSLLKLLDHEANQQSVGLLLIHALNPYGFAHRRRWNEQNIDLNRNFLLPGQHYAGAPPHYDQLNLLLNPSHAPKKFEGFYLKAIRAISKHGFASLQQAIAGGQYEYPKGLFFGGNEPSASYRILEENLSRWLGETPEVVHLDFHTGLGRWGRYQLLIEEPLESETGRWLESAFDGSIIRSPHNAKTAYKTSGGIGSWCKHLLSDRKYVYACAEFGTYGPLKVLTGLRAENQAYWHTPVDSPQRKNAAARLEELFCPASNAWRKQVVVDGVQLIQSVMASQVQL